MNRALRVVHLNDLANTGTILVDALRAEGVDALLIDPARPPRNLRYPRKALAMPGRLRALVAAALRARRERPDVVHVHYARQGWMGPLAGRPFLLHCHGTDVRGISPRSPWGRFVAPWLRRAERVLYATPDLEPWVTAFRPDAHFLPNPIPLHPQPEPDGPMVDVFVGVRFDPVKGSRRVIETLRRLVAIRPETTLTIVDQGVEREAALAAIGPAAIGARATVIPFAPHPRMPAIFARHRLAMGQMEVGALGNYELEAMAAGLPTAATYRFPAAYPAPPPLIVADEPQATAEQLAAMLDDEAARAALGAEARRWVADHHGTSSVARRVVALYEEVLAG